MIRLLWWLVGFIAGVVVAQNSRGMDSPQRAAVVVVLALMLWWAIRVYRRRDKAVASAVAVAVAKAEARAEAQAEARAQSIAQAAVHVHLAALQTAEPLETVPFASSVLDDLRAADGAVGRHRLVAGEAQPPATPALLPPPPEAVVIPRHA